MNVKYILTLQHTNIERTTKNSDNPEDELLAITNYHSTKHDSSL